MAPKNDESLSFLFTGLDRTHCVQFAVCSIRSYFKDAQILFGDQGRATAEMSDFCAQMNVEYVALPDDCGLAHARNVLLDRISSRFFVLMDDDHIVHEPQALQQARDFLAHHDEAVIVGGDFINFNYDEAGNLTGSYKKSYSYVLTYDERLGAIYCTPPQHGRRAPVWFREQPFHHVDITHNYFVCDYQRLVRTGVRWDDRMKIGGEHMDFFLRLKAVPAAKVFYSPALTVQHHRFVSRDYLEKRRRPIGRDILDEKWKLRAGIIYLDSGIRYPFTAPVVSNDELRKVLFGPVSVQP